MYQTDRTTTVQTSSITIINFSSYTGTLYIPPRLLGPTKLLLSSSASGASSAAEAAEAAGAAAAAAAAAAAGA